MLTEQGARCLEQAATWRLQLDAAVAPSSCLLASDLLMIADSNGVLSIFDVSQETDGLHACCPVFRQQLMPAASSRAMSLSRDAKSNEQALIWISMDNGTLLSIPWSEVLSVLQASGELGVARVRPWHLLDIGKPSVLQTLTRPASSSSKAIHSNEPWNLTSQRPAVLDAAADLLARSATQSVSRSAADTVASIDTTRTYVYCGDDSGSNCYSLFEVVQVRPAVERACPGCRFLHAAPTHADQ